MRICDKISLGLRNQDQIFVLFYFAKYSKIRLFLCRFCFCIIWVCQRRANTADNVRATYDKQIVDWVVPVYLPVKPDIPKDFLFLNTYLGGLNSREKTDRIFETCLIAFNKILVRKRLKIQSLTCPFGFAKSSVLQKMWNCWVIISSHAKRIDNESLSQSDKCLLFICN